MTEIDQYSIAAHVEPDFSVQLTTGQGCYFGAGLMLYPNMESKLIMRELYVDEQFRGQGIGTRLVRSMFYIAKELQPDRFSGHITSPITPYIVKNVVGEENITYIEHNRIDHTEIELPLTTRQASDSLERILRDGDAEYGGITVKFDLSSIALGQLEKPIRADDVIAALKPRIDKHRTIC